MDKEYFRILSINIVQGDLGLFFPKPASCFGKDVAFLVSALNLQLSVVPHYPQEEVQTPEEAFKVIPNLSPSYLFRIKLHCVHTEPHVLNFQFSETLSIIPSTLKTLYPKSYLFFKVQLKDHLLGAVKFFPGSLPFLPLGKSPPLLFPLVVFKKIFFPFDFRQSYYDVLRCNFSFIFILLGVCRDS